MLFLNYYTYVISGYVVHSYIMIIAPNEYVVIETTFNHSLLHNQSQCI